MRVRVLFRSAVQAKTLIESLDIRTGSPYVYFGTRRPLEWAPDLMLFAFEWVQSIEGAIETCWIVRIRIAPTWLSLWESCRRRRLRGFWGSVYPLRPRFAQTPLPTGEARNAGNYQPCVSYPHPNTQFKLTSCRENRSSIRALSGASSGVSRLEAS